MVLVEVNSTDPDRVELENYWKNEHFKVPKHRVHKRGPFDGVNRFEGWADPEENLRTHRQRREPLKKAVVMAVSGRFAVGVMGEEGGRQAGTQLIQIQRFGTAMLDNSRESHSLCSMGMVSVELGGVCRSTEETMTEGYRGAEWETQAIQECLGRVLEEMTCKLIHDHAELTRRESDTNVRQRRKQPGSV